MNSEQRNQRISQRNNAAYELVTRIINNRVDLTTLTKTQRREIEMMMKRYVGYATWASSHARSGHTFAHHDASRHYTVVAQAALALQMISSALHAEASVF